MVILRRCHTTKIWDLCGRVLQYVSIVYCKGQIKSRVILSSEGLLFLFFRTRFLYIVVWN